MSRALQHHRMITRRAFVLGGVQAAGMVGLVGRLYYLQFVKGEEFTTQAEGNRIKLQLMIPPRGVIADRQGVPMARNQVHFRLMLETENRVQSLETLPRLTALLGLPKEEEERLRVQVKRTRNGLPILVREHVPWETMARVQYHAPELPAAVIEEGQWRHYPFAAGAAHLIGYVGRVAEAEAAKSTDPLLRLPDIRIGKNGIEQRNEEDLRGIAGTRQMEVNVVGAPVRELKKHPPQQAAPLALTIDSRLQQACVERLADQSGAVVVMDVHQGDLLALVSVPAFDPNEFSKGITTQYWKELNANPKNPLLNKAIAGQYPPGSTFKMVTGLAGLEAGICDAKRRIYCPGHFMLGNHRFGCWKPEGHGSLTMAEALEQSCDTYFYTIAHEMGIEKLALMGEAMGLGQRTELGLSGERGGIMPSPAWKRAARGAVWNPGETINTAIGQGDVLATPLQMATMLARMINGGKRILPRLLLSEPVRDLGQLDVAPEHLAIVMDGMHRVINSPRGTAYASRILEAGMSFAGKTGTAQVRKILIHGQDQNTIPWQFRHHAWFVGYAPAENPRYACAVIIEHGGGGSSAAAPVARDVLQKLQSLGL